MKKCLVVLTGVMLLALFVPTAGASILSGYIYCGGVGSVTGTTGFVGGVAVPVSSIDTSGVATITCSSIGSVPSGDYISQVDLELRDDAQKPVASGASVISTWTGVSGLTFVTNNPLEVITTGSTDGTSFDQCLPTSGMTATPPGTCPTFLDFAQAGMQTSFGPVKLTVSATAGTGGGVGLNGGDSADLYIQYEYSSVVPEPATLGLMGMALLGLVFGSKKLSRRR
jgi:hypothetical protein